MHDLSFVPIHTPPPFGPIFSGSGTVDMVMGVTQICLLCRETQQQPSFLFEDCPCNVHVTRCLRIAFIWSPTFLEQVEKMQLLNFLQTDLTIVEPGNAYEKTTVLSREWRDGMEEIVRQDENRHIAILH